MQTTLYVPYFQFLFPLRIHTRFYNLGKNFTKNKVKIEKEMISTGRKMILGFSVSSVTRRQGTLTMSTTIS